MNWKPELDELARREAFAREMGGVDKVKRQHDQGRLTVRERIEKLIDTGSFHEIGAVSGIGEYHPTGELKTVTPANCVFGRARVDGRTVVVAGEDFTVRGGSADASISAKPLMAEEMAHDFRLPIVRIIEGSGGGGSVKTIETKGAANLPGGIGGTRWYRFTIENLSRVPVVALGLGSVAGLGAARLAASHYSIMTKKSAMFVGPARLEGRAVMLLASDSYHYGGSWTADACQKVVRWVDFAETFHLPIVYLMDCPGFMIGLDAEKAATIRHGVRAMAAVNQTTVPWCTVILRNAFGVAGVVHQPADRFSIRYAWPSAYWGSLPLEGGIEAAYRADIDAAEDKAAKLKEIEERLNKLRSPFRSAEKFWVEEIIDPRKTRGLLCEFARLAEPLRKPGPPENFSIRP